MSTRWDLFRETVRKLEKRCSISQSPRYPTIKEMGIISPPPLIYIIKDRNRNRILGTKWCPTQRRMSNKKLKICFKGINFKLIMILMMSQSRNMLVWKVTTLFLMRWELIIKFLHRMPLTLKAQSKKDKQIRAKGQEYFPFSKGMLVAVAFYTNKLYSQTAF